MSIAKLAGISAAVALFVAGVAVAGAVQDKTVQITEKGYSPDRLEVTVGERVVFTNTTQKDHTVTSKKPIGKLGQEQDRNKEKGQDRRDEKNESGFDSGVIKPRTSWEYTFTKAGTYAYSCKEDKSMTGTIIVRAAK